ncbi:MAG: universal stress protein, partial [Gemmatimonadaceae bacterium]|nr:universal stress protein [Gemmatimonadaceae bacterium]
VTPQVSFSAAFNGSLAITALRFTRVDATIFPEDLHLLVEGHARHTYGWPPWLRHGGFYLMRRSRKTVVRRDEDIRLPCAARYCVVRHRPRYRAHSCALGIRHAGDRGSNCPFRLPNPFIGGYSQEFPTLNEHAQLAAESEVKSRVLALDESEARGITTEVEVTDGRDTAEAICAAAERFGANVICVGSHTRPGFTTKVLGSVAFAREARRRPDAPPPAPADLASRASTPHTSNTPIECRISPPTCSRGLAWCTR